MREGSTRCMPASKSFESEGRERENDAFRRRTARTCPDFREACRLREIDIQERIPAVDGKICTRHCRRLESLDFNRPLESVDELSCFDTSNVDPSLPQPAMSASPVNGSRDVEEDGLKRKRYAFTSLKLCNERDGMELTLFPSLLPFSFPSGLPPLPLPRTELSPLPSNDDDPSLLPLPHQR